MDLSRRGRGQHRQAEIAGRDSGEGDGKHAGAVEAVGMEARVRKWIPSSLASMRCSVGVVSIVAAGTAVASVAP
jgi:hypothetical protein